MISLPEYASAVGQLKSLGASAETNLIHDLGPEPTKIAAITAANVEAEWYHGQRKQVIHDTLNDAGDTILNYYSDALNKPLSKSIVEKAINNLYIENFYGATLAARLRVSQTRLIRRITRSAQIGPLEVAKAWTQRIPFGAQLDEDKRLLLGMLAKLENDIAREVAKDQEIPLVKWQLSGRHSQPDICDDLASAVNKDVVTYISANNLKLDPKGLYFRETLPLPPHPNCQCEYGLVTEKGVQKTGKVKRALNKLRGILKNLRKK